MGAWGHGSFENDDASDWVYELEESGNEAIDQALSSVADGAPDYIEEPDAAMALAAAETVAALRGRPAADLPDEVRQWVKGKPAPDDARVAKAKSAVAAILNESEMKELWHETDDYSAWEDSVRDLQSRLTSG